MRSVSQKLIKYSSFYDAKTADARTGCQGVSVTPWAGHSGPTEVEDCSLPLPNMAATKAGEQGNAWFSILQPSHTHISVHIDWYG